jgi:ATP-dependent Clp protease ATP-binding subunit ClpA
MSTFDRYLEDVIERATREAEADGSSTVEAHHLLLAIAASDDSELGLDRVALRSALDREFTHSLAAAGVRLSGDVPPPSPSSSPTLGATARTALERGLAVVGRKQDARPAHLLIGILSAEVGTVPRALSLAGVDRTAVIARLTAGTR